MKVNRKKTRGLIFVVSGPSGSGKTTLLQKLPQDKELSKRIIKSISYTTRPQRTNEKDNQDYFFITEKEFKRAQKAKKILEWTKYLGYYYGTPKEFVDRKLDEGKHIMLCLDLQGAQEIKRLYPKNSVTIFINPPSLEALQQRIGKRCNKTKKQEIKERLALARQEILASSQYDYCLMNNKLDRAVRDLKGIILGEISIIKERGGI